MAAVEDREKLSSGRSHRRRAGGWDGAPELLGRDGEYAALWRAWQGTPAEHS